MNMDTDAQLQPDGASESADENASATPPDSADDNQGVELARAKLDEAPDPTITVEWSSSIPSEIKKFQHSSRRKRALSLLESPNPWSPLSFRENASQLINAEPGEYTREEYAREIDCYTQFKHEMVDFDKNSTELNFRRWINHSDINIFVIENKFPIDSNVRDYITAFKLILKSYQWIHILSKRLIQVAAILIYVLIVLNVPSLAELFPFIPNTSPAHFAVVGLLFALLLAAMYGLILSITDNFKARLQSTAASLGAVLNSKTSSINTRFAQVCNNAGSVRNDFSAAERDWIESAKWLMRVAMWLPKRVDYLDRFFQLEMQNVRAFRNGSSIIGNLTSIGIFLVSEAVLISLLFLEQSGLEGSPVDQNVLFLFLAAMFFVGISSWMTTLGRVSLSNSDILLWMNEQSWTQFGDFDMFRNIEGILQTYAYQVYADQNRGSSRG